MGKFLDAGGAGVRPIGRGIQPDCRLVPMHPNIFFSVLPKRLRPQARVGGQPPLAAAPRPETNGPYPQGVCRIRKAAEPPTAARLHGPKEKAALVATLHVRAKLLYGGRREIVPACSRWLPDGRGGVRCGFDSGFPRRGCRRKSGCKDAFDQLLFPRVPLRYALPWRSWGPVLQGGLIAFRVPVGADALIGPCRGSHQPPGQRQRKEKQFNAMTTPTRSAPSATGRQSQESQKGIACPKARQNRSRHRSADPRRARRATAPKRVKAFFLFGPCNRAAVGGSAALRMRHTPCGYGPFLFWQDQKRNGGCICPAIIMAAYTVAALRFPSPGGAADRAASSKPPRFLRRWRRFGDFPRPMGRSPAKKTDRLPAVHLVPLTPGDGLSDIRSSAAG